MSIYIEFSTLLLINVLFNILEIGMRISINIRWTEMWPYDDKLVELNLTSTFLHMQWKNIDFVGGEKVKPLYI